MKLGEFIEELIKLEQAHGGQLEVVPFDWEIEQPHGEIDKIYVIKDKKSGKDILVLE